MTYPNIFPIEPAKDGWGLLFDTPTSRLLYHCGLVIDKPAAGTRRRTWKVGHHVSDSVRSEETRPLKVSREAVRKAVGRVARMFGTAEAERIVAMYGVTKQAPELRPEVWGSVYRACHYMLNNSPRAGTSRTR